MHDDVVNRIGPFISSILYILHIGWINSRLNISIKYILVCVYYVVVITLPWRAIERDRIEVHHARACA